MLKYREALRLIPLLQPGDRVLVEYTPDIGLGDFEWKEMVRAFVKDGTVVAFDFYGIGDLLFRNYIRSLGWKDYKDLIEAKKNIYVFKFGPGGASYGQLMGEEKIHSDTESFLRSYYSTIRRALNLPRKPKYSFILGLAEYLYFSGKDGLYNFLHATSTIPLEDWVTFIFLNVGAIGDPERAILEEISSWVLAFRKNGIEVIKGGRESAHQGGGEGSAD
ncbi:hypothetical protein A3L09_08275 [Thermococcus profundus]|uniref:Uncharacterized protein n=1 Tax=Thermococcus profundus TaxID=49899 RepID=A0A2Z2MCM5_THEPR|nr:hypothetical protein [Thermococcus profundus]ASJ03249.1 hypothetical protein A3L09_08275 [Thermococcus profundus]